MNQIDCTLDSEKVDVYNNLSWNLRNSNPEKAIEYGKIAIELSEKIDYANGLVKAYSFSGVAYRNSGDYTNAFEFYYKGLELAIKYNLLEQQGYAYTNMGNLYIYQEYFEDAVENLTKSLEIADSLDNQKMLAYSNLNLGRAYLLNLEYEKALSYFNTSINIRIDLKDIGGQAVCIKYIADVYTELQKLDSALILYKKSLELTDFDDDKDLLANIYNKISYLYLKKDKLAEADLYAHKSFEVASEVGTKLRMKEAAKSLADIYMINNNFEKACHYQNLVICYTDTLFSQKLTEKITNIKNLMEQQQKQSEIDILNRDTEIKDLKLAKQKNFILSLISVLTLTFVLIILLFFSNKQRKKSL